MNYEDKVFTIGFTTLGDQECGCDTQPRSNIRSVSSQLPQFTARRRDRTQQHREFERARLDQVLRQGHRAAGVTTQAALHHIQGPVGFISAGEFVGVVSGVQIIGGEVAHAGLHQGAANSQQPDRRHHWSTQPNAHRSCCRSPGA